MDPLVEPYIHALGEFPVTGTPAAKLRAALRFAVLAPSSHNSQPWRFHIHRDALDLWADRLRGLPVADPEDRELAISCGAALFNLLVTLRHFGHDPLVDLLPGGADRMARVELGPSYQPAEMEHALFEAIPRRHTNRQPFADRAVDPALVTALERCARQEGAWLAPLDQPPTRTAVADLIWEADKQQMASRPFRRELATWMHPNRTSSRDGIPGYALGFSEVMSLAAPLVIRTFDLGGGRAARSRELATGSPLLAVLGTDGDSVRDWIAAGLALEHVLLRAEIEGVRTSFLNQPVEIPELRSQLAQLTGKKGYPQLVLRMGYAEPARATPRRSVEETLV